MYRNLKYSISAHKYGLRRYSIAERTTSSAGVTSTSSTEAKDISSKFNSDEVSTLIIGGGIVGNSIAYHLAKQGAKDVVLLEKAELTAGSTWHAAGLTTTYHPIVNLKKIHYYSLNMYSKLAQETGQETGLHQPGSIRLATTPKTVDEFRYQMSRAGGQPAPQFLLNPDEILEMVPILKPNRFLMGLYTPNDGHIDPYSTAQAIAKGARMYGATIMQGVEVTSLKLKEDGKWTVETPLGDIVANNVVNAAGFWAKEVGRLAGLELPLVAIQHQYLVTSSVPELRALNREFPVLRHIEASCYIRQERDGFLIGAYESPDTMKLQDQWFQDGVPKGFGKELFPSDLERMLPYLQQIMDDIPSFATAKIQNIINGPITYTPDNIPMVGPSLLPNLWLAVGFGYGIIHAGGMGKFVADWIQNGEPSHDLIECDPGRFGTWTSEEYVLAKARESYGMNNATGYPREERFAGRPTVRVTPAYQTMIDRGASMEMGCGWEHPAWFAEWGQVAEYKPSFQRTNWHDAVGREWSMVTKGVGVIDLSPFGKFYLEGCEAPQFLDSITANKIPGVKRSAVTHMLTPRAKVCAELTVTRLSENKFLVITGASSEIHDLRWMKEIIRKEGWKVNIRVVSEELGCLSVAGPKSKQLLSKLNPRFNEKFPFFRSDEISINGVDTIALRLTYTGELGWELYYPIDQTNNIYEAILDAGQQFGVGDFGSLTVNVLRLEKGFRLWGKEMNHDRNIAEAGLMPFVDLNKDFIGKSALEKILRTFPSRELVMIKIDESATSDPQGDESIWLGNHVIGNTTSGCFSYLLNQPLAFAYLPPYLATPGTLVEVEMMRTRYPSVVLPRPPDLTYSEKQKLKKGTSKQ